MGKWHYRLDGWKKGPWVFENLDSISENRLSVPEMMFEIFSGVLLLNKESSVWNPFANDDHIVECLTVSLLRGKYLQHKEESAEGRKKCFFL